MKASLMQRGAFILLLLLVSAAFFWLVADFMMPVFWAAVLAILFRPVFTRFRKLFRRFDGVAALATIVFILVMVVFPLYLLGVAVVREAQMLYQNLMANGVDANAVVAYLEDITPRLREWLASYNIDLNKIQDSLSGSAVTVSQLIASRTLVYAQNAFWIGALFFLMLYVLFYFLRDGDKITAGLIRALPLGDDRERQLMARFAVVARATMKGTVIVGMAQGAIGGFILWTLGVGAPILLGVLMVFVSILPAVGPALVWFPIAVYLLATGAFAKGLILMASGVFLVGLVDNLLRPVLVGRDTAMPDYLVLLSTLGGISIFGISGFVLGPAIAAFFLTVWNMFADEYAEADTETAALIDVPSHAERALTVPPEATEAPDETAHPPTA